MEFNDSLQHLLITKSYAADYQNVVCQEQYHYCQEPVAWNYIVYGVTNAHFNEFGNPVVDGLIFTGNYKQCNWGIIFWDNTGNVFYSAMPFGYYKFQAAEELPGEALQTWDVASYLRQRAVEGNCVDNSCNTEKNNIRSTCGGDTNVDWSNWDFADCSGAKCMPNTKNNLGSPCNPGQCCQ